MNDVNLRFFLSGSKRILFDKTKAIFISEKKADKINIIRMRDIVLKIIELLIECKDTIFWSFMYKTKRIKRAKGSKIEQREKTKTFSQ